MAWFSFDVRSSLGWLRTLSTESSNQITPFGYVQLSHSKFIFESALGDFNRSLYNVLLTGCGRVARAARERDPL